MKLTEIRLSKPTKPGRFLRPYSGVTIGGNNRSSPKGDTNSYMIPSFLSFYPWDFLSL